MNEIQKSKVGMTKDYWLKVGCVYEKIVEKNDIVYMVLTNGTALSIEEDGSQSWVVENWD